MEDPEAASIGELVLHEIHRPSGVGHRLGDKRRAGAEGALAAPPSPDCQTLLAVEPLGALAVHHMAVATQDHMQPPIAEPPVLLGVLRKASRSPASSGRLCRYRTDDRSTPGTEHARRSLIS